MLITQTAFVRRVQNIGDQMNYKSQVNINGNIKGHNLESVICSMLRIDSPQVVELFRQFQIVPLPLIKKEIGIKKFNMCNKSSSLL